MSILSVRCWLVSIVAKRWWFRSNHWQWALRRRLWLQVTRMRRSGRIVSRAIRTSLYCAHGVLEDDSLVVALALSLRFDTVVAYRSSFVTFYSALSASFIRAWVSVAILILCL